MMVRELAVTGAALLKAWLIWGGAFLGLMLVQGLGGGGSGPWTASVPHWAAMAILLGAFPAGVGVAAHLVGPRRVHWDHLVGVGVLAAVAAGLFLALVGWMAPSALAGAGALAEGRALSLPELAGVVDSALTHADASGDPAAWMSANELVFELDRRIVQTLLVVVLPLLGAAVGHWALRIPLRGVRWAFLWALGLFLLVAEYFALENGFELVAMRTVGVASPAGAFALIVPGALLIGFGLAALVDVLGAPREVPA